MTTDHSDCGKLNILFISIHGYDASISIIRACSVYACFTDREIHLHNMSVRYSKAVLMLGITWEFLEILNCLFNKAFNMDKIWINV